MFKKENLVKLQETLKKDNLKAYLIVTSDPHNSEYIATYYKSFREYFCPFTGSAGQLLVTQDAAYLFTDGRYWIQAENELKDSGVTLVKVGDKDVPTLDKFIRKNELTPLGCDLSMVTRDFLETLRKKNVNLVDKDYGYLIENRPSLSEEKVWKLREDLYTLTYQEKIDRIIKELDKKGVEACLITPLDEVAYVLNLRGNDIPCNPVFYAYLYISKNNGNHLFINKKKIDFELEGIKIHEYDEIFSFMKKYRDIKTLVDSSRVNARVFHLIYSAVRGKNPSYLMKAIKDEAEIENTKRIQAIDGLALVKFKKYLRENLSKNLTEFDYATKLEEFRRESKELFELSFDTIAAVGSNGAQMHYEPTKEKSSIVNDKNIELLVDSGGQYYGGTTDTTRTFLIGKPTEEFKHDYTLTLKAVIAVSDAVFIDGSDGHTLDIKAREFMWKEGMDYKCGTGHGVGYMLNVHEGPNGLRYKKVPERDDQSPIVPGMITTIEPGVYKEGKYGIRIENNLLCVPAFETDMGVFYKFETITYVPIDVEALNLNELTDQEIEWLNNYHDEVYKKLAPLTKDKELLDFLRNQTRKIFR
ncbi:MAG: aminopeptidase P family protein [Bacilli bacterium]|nr:aminopeptidase P family protein [Bacilli bacterium]